MLPRIIIAAILMNLSYYICQILVDVSNILGVGVSSLVSATSGNTFSENVANVSDLSKIVVAAGLIAIVAFFFLIPVLLAFLAVIFTIAARNAIIVLLVIVAPLAFAAWILPNTEKYFKKWWELLINMLLLFPMVMLVFSASVVAANVIGSVNPSGGTASEELQGMIALLVLALPLFALPFLFKASSGILGRINAMTQQRLQQGVDSKAGQAVRNKTKAYGKFGAYAAGAGAAKGMNKATRGRMFDPKNPGKLTRGYRNVRAFDKAVETSLEARKQGKQAEYQEQAARLGSSGLTGMALGGVGGSRYQEIASAQVDKAFAERKSAIRAAFDQRPPSSDLATELKGFHTEFRNAVASGDAATSGAIVDYLTSARGASGRQGLEKILTETLADPNVAIKEGSEVHKALNNAINRDNYSTLVSKRGAIAKGGFKLEDGRVTGYNLDLGGVGTEQLATQDAKSLADNFDQVKAEEAWLVLNNEELRSKISDAESRKLLERKAAEYTPPVSTNSNNDGEIIIPRPNAQPSQTRTPTAPQQQRSAGGNFNGGPGANLPPANPPNNPPNPPGNPPSNP